MAKKAASQKTAKMKSTQKTEMPRKLAAAEVKELLGRLPSWELYDGQIVRTYAFKNFYETVAFVNAVAWVANAANHHPDLEVSYSACRVKFSTHDVGGLSSLDFVTATQVESLISKT